jgi:uncharacterized membrane protein (DUF106 family)
MTLNEILTIVITVVNGFYLAMVINGIIEMRRLRKFKETHKKYSQKQKERIEFLQKLRLDDLNSHTDEEKSDTVDKIFRNYFEAEQDVQQITSEFLKLL